jgi:hypothetical protein
MAINQTRISKKPKIGAMILLPREIKTIRKVSIVTSTILVEKIKMGSKTYENHVEWSIAEAKVIR